jgi:hypothetical protein
MILAQIILCLEMLKSSHTHTHTHTHTQKPLKEKKSVKGIEESFKFL